LTVLLFPFSFIYKTIALLDWYIKNRRRHTFPNLFVISIDNLTFGGSGKTSLVCYIASFLSEKQIPFAIVSRGYKSTVSKGHLAVTQNDKVKAVGDEAYMLKSLFPQSTIIIGPDRLTALKELNLGPAHVVILDDGFQSAHIQKDFSILLDTPHKPFYYYRNFRFMAKKTDLRLRFQSGENTFSTHPPALPSYRFLHTGLKNVKHEPVFVGSNPIIAFSALGDNQRFYQDLKKHYYIEDFFSFPDHHFFTPSDIDTIKKAIRKTQSSYCVCTLKDFVKLPREVQLDTTFIYAVNGIQLNFDLLSHLMVVEKFREHTATSP